MAAVGVGLLLSSSMYNGDSSTKPRLRCFFPSSLRLATKRRLNHFQSVFSDSNYEETPSRDHMLKDFRNIGIIGGISSGKTRTTDHILFTTGSNYKTGDETTTDWMVQEEEMGCSITSATTHTLWKKHHIDIIDTPGHIDFKNEVECALQVVDGAICLFDCAQAQPQSEVVWRLADKYNLPRICFINKMDRLGANFFRTYEMMVSNFDAKLLLLQIPIGTEDTFKGVIDLIRMKAIVWGDYKGVTINNNMYVLGEDHGSKFLYQDIPYELQQLSQEYRALMMYKIMELHEGYLQPDEETLKKLIRQGTLRGNFVPVLCGSALKLKGVQPLLDAVVDYLPSPLDVPPVTGIDPYDPETKVSLVASDDKPFAALAFKVMNCRFLGYVTFLRVYSGKLNRFSNVLNANKGKIERIERLLKMNADTHEDLCIAFTGEIVAVPGLKDTVIGEMLCDSERLIVLQRIDFPVPVIKVALKPNTKKDLDNMANALIKLAREDPSFHFSRDEETNQTVIEGMGELYLEVIVDRLKREFKVEANAGAPHVNYRESISVTSETRYVHKVESGQEVEFADITVRFEPSEARSGLIFKSEIKGGELPREYINSVMQGLEESRVNGVLAGFPVVDICAVLTDGDYNENSSVRAFNLAARGAFREGVRKAAPKILEPIMSLQAVTPKEYLEDVIGDLSLRRGQINSYADKPGGLKVVDSLVPIAEMFQYMNTLRVMTKGRASYIMQLVKFGVVPQHIQNQLAASKK